MPAPIRLAVEPALDSALPADGSGRLQQHYPGHPAASLLLQEATQSFGGALPLDKGCASGRDPAGAAGPEGGHAGELSAHPFTSLAVSLARTGPAQHCEVAGEMSCPLLPPSLFVLLPLSLPPSYSPPSLPVPGCRSGGLAAV